MGKIFKNIKLMIDECKHTFSIICLTETWCSNETFHHNFNLHIPQYNFIHLEKIINVVVVVIDKKLIFKHREEHSV